MRYCWARETAQQHQQRQPWTVAACGDQLPFTDDIVFDLPLHGASEWSGQRTSPNSTNVPTRYRPGSGLTFFCVCHLWLCRHAATALRLGSQATLMYLGHAFPPTIASQVALNKCNSTMLMVCLVSHSYGRSGV